jgi:hypothetical protein
VGGGRQRKFSSNSHPWSSSSPCSSLLVPLPLCSYDTTLPRLLFMLATSLLSLLVVYSPVPSKACFVWACKRSQLSVVSSSSLLLWSCVRRKKKWTKQKKTWDLHVDGPVKFDPRLTENWRNSSNQPGSENSPN